MNELLEKWLERVEADFRNIGTEVSGEKRVELEAAFQRYLMAGSGLLTGLLTKEQAEFERTAAEATALLIASQVASDVMKIGEDNIKRIIQESFSFAMSTVLPVPFG